MHECLVLSCHLSTIAREVVFLGILSSYGHDNLELTPHFLALGSFVTQVRELEESYIILIDFNLI